jgi:23S rRNA pseudouridine2604 synthase
MEYPIRLNKYLAHQGYASRREADALIESGKVRVNGTPVPLGTHVNAADTVEVISTTQKTKRYLAYYKGRGVITHSPGPHEVDIATKLATDYGITDVYPVGRLDKESEGLILLTNDGRVTRTLLAPEHNHERIYDVTVDKPVNKWFVRHMENGIDIEGYTTKPASAHPHHRNSRRFTLTLTEGKKHQIRRMCAALGFQVTTLKRVGVANISLGKLKPNQYRKISGPELHTFLRDLNLYR